MWILGEYIIARLEPYRAPRCLCGGCEENRRKFRRHALVFLDSGEAMVVPMGWLVEVPDLPSEGLDTLRRPSAASPVTPAVVEMAFARWANEAAEKAAEK